MPSRIPIRNIYYLLCYAWDQLEEAKEIDVSTDDCETLDELFARVLASGCRHLLKRGLDRNYRTRVEELSLPRGKFEVTRSINRLSIQQARMVCEFDELSHDILHNRLIKSTLDILVGNDNIDNSTRSDLLDLQRLLSHIRGIRITSQAFRRVRLHRNNRAYRLLLNICELIHDSRLPNEEKGKSRFRDFYREEEAMASLFEKFIYQFYHRHTPFQVSAAHLQWNAVATVETMGFLPRMETDVSLYSPDRQIILDCKFYKKAFKSRGEGQRQKFNRDHLFQLYSYLRNARSSKDWNQVEGVILYPANSSSFHHRFILDGYPVQIASVDLARPWQEIHDSLRALILDS